jgi:hypothetical protein
LGAGKVGGSVGARAGVGALGGAQSDAAAVSVDVPLLICHYVDVMINGESNIVKCYYSLCRKPLKTQLMGVEMLRRWFA